LKAALAALLRASQPTVRPADVENAYKRVIRNREIRATIDALKAAGARVEYHSIDVRKEEALGGLIENIYREHGRLDLVIHGAGIIEDKLIRDKTPESFDNVVHTKTDSAWLLSRCLRPESLKCLIFMSSTTAAYGNRGQADYAAANGAMNGFAAMLSAQWNRHVVAMCWGPWDQGGMVSEEVRQQFVSLGVQLIDPVLGSDAVRREIESGGQASPLVTLGGGPWAKSALGAVAAPNGTGDRHRELTAKKTS
jgi:NAD(P)-dependent dehydrogenase (short-subunit alcohol dehydrogenase family)